MKAPKLLPSPRKAAKYARAGALAQINAKRMRDVLGDRSDWPVQQLLRTGIHLK